MRALLPRVAGLLCVMLALAVAAMLAGRLRPMRYLALSGSALAFVPASVNLLDAQVGVRLNLSDVVVDSERDLDLAADGAIAFVRSGSGQRRVCILRPAQAERCLPASGGWETEPRWSPDGRALLVTVPGQDGMSRLHVLSPETGSSTPLPSTGGSASQADWAPDGRRIAASSTTPVESQLVVFDTHGGPPRVLTGALRASSGPRWSPDGRRLAFIDTADRLALISAEGGSVQQLTSGGNVHSLAWSPDGQAIAFAADVNGEVDVFIQRLSDGQQRNISRSVEGASMPVWSPDGATIAYIARSGRSPASLALYDIASGETRLMPLDMPDVNAPAWAVGA